ncbi:MAG TPA: helix-hairpin-helix domain-containing protein [Chitinophagales bacterium]|nr:helix-hairpin-helix domain-containing protein [Chitinophagales bacterium]
MLLTFLIFLFPKTAFSQIDTSQKVQEKQDELLEQITENGENQALDYENLVDLENTLSKHPINLNKASKEDFQPLLDLKLLNDIQINSILNYRQQLGNFIEIYELEAVPYLDVSTIEAIRPFVFISAQPTNLIASVGEMLTKGDYMVLIRGSQTLEQQKGFSPADSNSTSRYLGSPLNLYARYRYTYGTKFSYGITGQKDAGEEFFKGTQQHGFDFYSAHVFYSGKSIVKGVVLGDYELNFGQGMIVGAGFGVSKSSLITAIKNGGRTIRPYTSTDEFNFFRGGAVQLGSKHVNATLFGSYKKIDGNVGAIDTIGDNVFVTSYGGNGYHRTLSETGNKYTISQKTFGGNLDYTSNSFTAGGTFFHTEFSSPVVPSYQPYNIYNFRGDHLSDYGLHFDWQYKNFNLYAEGVKSDPGGIGAVSGLLISVDPKVDLAFVYRNYARDFHSIYSNAFGESSSTENEKGLYSGVIIRPSGKWELDVYADFFRKAWLAYLVNAPSIGTDYLAQLNYRPSKTVVMYVRWRDKRKQTNSSLSSETINYLVNTENQNLRFNLSYKASASLTLNSRAEWAFYHEEKLPVRHGFLVYQDVKYKFTGVKLNVGARFMLFDADTYDSRLYAYEDEVLYAYSVPVFSNRGIRWYLLARYSIMRGVDVWLRFAQTYYSNLNTIGNGLDEINGNTKTELKAEVRFRF